MYIYSFDSDTIGELKQTISGITREPAVLKYSPEGAYIGIGTSGRDVCVYNTTDYKVNMAYL